MTVATKPPANANTREPAHPPSREFLERQAFEAFKAFVLAFQDLLGAGDQIRIQRPLPAPVDEPASDVLTADAAAAFLGVDRNTVYDYAARGVIPHQRLGKRILFGRAALVSWLDSSLCKATSTRKG